MYICVCARFQKCIAHIIFCMFLQHVSIHTICVCCRGRFTRARGARSAPPRRFHCAARQARRAPSETLKGARHVVTDALCARLQSGNPARRRRGPRARRSSLCAGGGAFLEQERQSQNGHSRRTRRFPWKTSPGERCRMFIVKLVREPTA